MDSLWDEECFELIEEGGYHLVLDETVSLVNKSPITPQDYRALKGTWVGTEATNIKGMEKVFPVENIDDYNGKHTDFLGLVKTGHIFVIKGADGKEKLVVFVVPPEKITCFEECHLLTYLFKGSETENWFKVFDVDYKHLKLDRAGNMKWSLIDHDGEYCGSQFRELINIVDDRKLNTIGRKKQGMRKEPLSANWFDEKYKKASRESGQDFGLVRLGNNLMNFFRHKMKAKPIDVFYTCPKKFRGILGNSYFDPGLKKRDKGEDTWLAVNTRATNDYADKRFVAVVQNIFPLRPVDAFFKYHGHKIDRDLYALSMLVQFIFRSAIRNGEQITLYLPSKRMRYLLQSWLQTEPVSSKMAYQVLRTAA